MAYKITSSVSIEPLTVEEAKSFLRVEHSDDNGLIASLITSARAQVESLTGLALASHSVEQYFDSWPLNGIFSLELMPVTSIAGVYYVADGASPGTYTTLNSSRYHTDLISKPQRVAFNDGEQFPDLEPCMNAVKIAYTADATSSSEHARSLAIAKQAIRFIVAHDYERRTDPITRLNANTVRRTEQLIRQIKMY